MRFRLPSFLQGWRHVAGEVGIIVIGVLIALGAEQAAETIHWKQQVRDARLALNAELAHSVGAYEHRRQQSRCVESRLNELDQWIRRWSRGEREALDGPIGRIAGFNQWKGVWGVTQSGQVAAHIPLKERLAYARIYDLLGSYAESRSLEREAWFILRDYDEASHLEHQDIIRIRGALARAKYLNRLIQLSAGTGFILDTAAELGVVPEKLQGPDLAAEAELCQPIPRRPIRPNERFQQT